MNPQLINPKTGEFTISEDFIFSAKTKISELMAYFGESNLTVRDMNNGHTNYWIGNFQIGKLYFIFTFYFFNKKIIRVSFILQKTSYLDIGSWDNFDEKEEIKNGEFLKLWLTGQMQGDYQKYKWGNIDVYYDHHNLSSSCIIKYEDDYNDDLEKTQ